MNLPQVAQKLYRKFSIFMKVGYRFVFTGSKIVGLKDSIIVIEQGVALSNVTINVGQASILHIGRNTSIKNVSINILGSAQIGNENIIQNGGVDRPINIEVNGSLLIGNKNRIECRIRQNHQSRVEIGACNNINFGSEIRCDESVKIGNYNQISYNVMIWDTNTHCIYSADQRRKLTDEHYPVFGFEYEKPKTKPICIGDDCWIGKDAAILKGTSVSNKCIVGFRTIISNEVVNPNTTIVQKTDYIRSENSI